MQHNLNPHELSIIAGIAMCDLRTARKFIRGGTLKPSTHARVSAALKALKRPDLIQARKTALAAASTDAD